jgi:hypothetical protein
MHRLGPCLTALRVLAKSKGRHRDAMIEKYIDQYLSSYLSYHHKRPHRPPILQNRHSLLRYQRSKIVSYIVRKHDGHRAEYEVDLPRFAADLAKQLDGVAGPYNKEYPNDGQVISLPGSLRLQLSASRYNRDPKKARISISLDVTDVRHDERNFYKPEHKAEYATVNPDRPFDQIVKDVRKRVIEASAPAIAAQREYAEIQRRDRSDIIGQAEALRRAIPNMAIHLNETEKRAVLYMNTDGVYIQGTLSHDGHVHIGHIGSMSVEKLKKIVAILESKE